MTKQIIRLNLKEYCVLSKKRSYMTEHIQFYWHNSYLPFLLNTRLLCKDLPRQKMNKTSCQQILHLQKIYYVPLFFLCDKKYIWHSTVLYQLVSLVTESIIMILHEPDVALQNWYAFILFLSHTPRTVLHCIVDI